MTNDELRLYLAAVKRRRKAQVLRRGVWHFPSSASVTPRSHSPAEGEAGAMSDHDARPPLPDTRVDEVLAEVRDELRQRRQDLPCQSAPQLTPDTSSSTATRVV